MSKTPPPLRQKLRDVATEAMLDAAERCMIANGYEQTTMQQIAAEAGCAIGTFYLYFKNKQELLRAICGRHGKLMHERIIAAYQQPIAPLEKVRAGLEMFLRYANEDQAFFRLFLDAVPLRLPHIHRFLDTDARKDHETAQDLELAALRQAQEQGQIRGDIPPTLLQEFLEGVCINTLESFLSSDPPPVVQQQIDTLWKFITGGVGANPPH